VHASWIGAFSRFAIAWEGLPLTAVSARLGHASPQITMSIYAHALNEHDAEASGLIGGIVAER